VFARAVFNRGYKFFSDIDKVGSREADFLRKWPIKWRIKLARNSKDLAVISPVPDSLGMKPYLLLQ